MDDEPQPTFSYDRVAYPSPVIETLTPDRLRASALLHGYNPPEATTASVLEIGCGDGVGLVAWASVAPKARVVGFDLSAGAVAKGRALAAEAGIANVDLHVGDILTYPRDGETFDYIVCHGVLSWVPDPVRDALVELIGARLAPGGIAFMSYDCMPGAALKSALVPLLRSRVPQTDDPQAATRSAAQVIDMIHRALRPDSRLREQIDILMETMLRTKVGYFYHDWLAEYYRPVELRQLIANAASHGLKIGGSASNYDLEMTDLDAEAGEMLRAFGDDHGSRLLALEILRGPFIFHRDLYIHADAPPPSVVDGHQLLTYAFDGEKEEIETAKGPATKYFMSDTFLVTTQSPKVRAILDLLKTNAPVEFSYEAIRTKTGLDDASLREILLDLCRNNFISNRTTASPFVLHPGERPVAGKLVQVMAQEGERIIDLRSTDLETDKDETRLLLILSDGTRSREQIATDLSGIVGREITPAMIESALTHYGRKRLFSA